MPETSTLLDKTLVSAPWWTTVEVADLLRVDPKTVSRWANAGKLAASRTPGGHLRFPDWQIQALLRDSRPESLPTYPTMTPLSSPTAAGCSMCRGEGGRWIPCTGCKGTGQV